MIQNYKYIISKGLPVVIVFVLVSCTSNVSFAPRKTAFNDGWSFHLNNKAIDNDTISAAVKWRNLNLPHDWSIEQAFNEHSPAGIGGGALDGGLGWYKKTFKITPQDSSKITSIVFDGVYMNSDVWINGHHLGNRPNGYIGFEYNLTPYLYYGDKENEILVKVNNAQQPNSRWYSGSGIYRNVWLKKTDKAHITQWGTFITTPKVSKEYATVILESNIANEYPEAKELTITTTLFFGKKEIRTASKKINTAAKRVHSVTQEFTVNEPLLWSPDEPNLYEAVTTIQLKNKTIDVYSTPFGIREFKFDLNKGLLLNGTQVKIKGVCLHHDLGPLGSAVNTRAIERQLEIMKEMGVNGIRTSHNAPAPELLDLCDKMGFIVMDEAFDMWAQAKNPYDYSLYWDKWHKRDLEDQIMRDRNHPSVLFGV